MGTRNYYAIYSASASFDDHEITPNLFYISQNKKEVIKRFRWLYEEFIVEDFINDEGEIFADHDIEIRDNPDDLYGYFYFMQDYYGVEYCIKTIKTDAFRSWGARDAEDRWEMAYQNYQSRERNGLNA